MIISNKIFSFKNKIKNEKFLNIMAYKPEDIKMKKLKY